MSRVPNITIHFRFHLKDFSLHLSLSLFVSISFSISIAAIDVDLRVSTWLLSHLIASFQVRQGPSFILFGLDHN